MTKPVRTDTNSDLLLYVEKTERLHKTL